MNNFKKMKLKDLRQCVTFGILAYDNLSNEEKVKVDEAKKVWNERKNKKK